MATALGRLVENVDEGESTLTDIARFDALDGDRAAQLLLPCCPSGRWAREVSAGRPYRSMRQLLTAADDVLADLSWSDVVRCRALLSEPDVSDATVAREQLRARMRGNLVTTLR